MPTIDQNKFKKHCDESLTSFFKEISTALCRTHDDMLTIHKRGGMRFIRGLTFSNPSSLRRARRTLSRSVAQIIGEEKTGYQELIDLAHNVFIDETLKGEEPDYTAYRTAFVKSLEAYLDNAHHYIGPCEGFEFYEGVTSLNSPFVSIKDGAAFLDDSGLGFEEEHLAVLSGEGFASDFISKPFTITLGGLAWDIKTYCAQENVPLQARWMAEVFTSLIRTGVTPAHFCHRGNLGEAEATPLNLWAMDSVGHSYAKDSLGGGTSSIPPRYRITKAFSEEFHSERFQDVLMDIFTPTKNALGARVANGLGWMTRGRQSKDPSERLLFFFTALEALLSEQDAWVPVAETIARFVSVMLAKKPEHREDAYKEVKRLYELRSHLVHRGQRHSHRLNANSVEHITEVCFASVLHAVSLKQPHKDFIQGLKSATHGATWPPVLGEHLSD